MATSARSYVLPDDILTAILELSKRESGKDRLVFRGHDDDLQRIFFRLSRNPEYSLLGQFVFSSSGPRSYSPALSDSVSKLQLAGLLGRQNPDYEVLFTTPSASRFYEEVLTKKFSKDEIDQLRNIAKEFSTLVPPM